VQELVDLELIVVDDPLRIGEVLTNGTAAGSIVFPRFDEMAIVLVQQEDIGQYFGGGNDIAATTTGIPVKTL